MQETIETRSPSFERPSTETGGSTTEQLIITRNSANGDVVSVERVDSFGRKTAVTEQELRKLVGEDEFTELADVLDEAFESGVTMIFEEPDDDEDDEDEDSIERSALLRALIIAVAGRRASRRFATARNKLFNKLILRRLVRRYFLRHAGAAY